MNKRLRASTVSVRDRQRANILLAAEGHTHAGTYPTRLAVGYQTIKTTTHDCIRHGTLTLFAALNYLEGKLITTIAEHHRHQECQPFLKKIERETPKDLAIHLITGNYATHKHPEVKAWLARHPRFNMHFTPTSSSWLNLVKRFPAI